MIDFIPFWGDINIRKDLRERLKKRREANLPVGKRVIKRIRTKLKTRAFNESLPRGRDVSVVSTDAPGNIIYGTCRVPGVITFFHTTGDDEFLHVVYTISCHEIQAVNNLYMDGVELTMGGDGICDGPGLFTDRVFWSKNLGAEDQAADTNLITNCPTKWTSNHRQRGCAHVYIKFTWHPQLFKDGLPNVEFGVQGKKVYDNRITATAWSDNAALCIADFLTDTKIGCSIASANIDYDSVDDAADVCEETVDSYDRYRINGYFNTDASYGQIIEEMEQAIAGYVTRSSDKWRVLAGDYVAPSISLDENDIWGNVRFGVKMSQDDLFNGVMGTFVDENTNYSVGDFAPVTNSTYETEDGSQKLEEISMMFTTRNEACERIAKIYLEDVRQQFRLSAIFSPKAYQLQVGENVSLSFDRYGWSSKVFRVEHVEPVEIAGSGAPMLAIELDLKETASGIYDWNNGDATGVDLAQNTTLPDPFAGEDITGIALASGTDHLDVRLDGTIFTRIKVSWTALTSYFTTSGGKVEIQYKKSAEGTYLWATSVGGDATFTYLLDVQDGVAYDVRIRAVNALGVGGAWDTETSYTVVGKTAAPDDVAVFTASLEKAGIRLNWNEIDDLDRAFYEIRVGDSWVLGSLICKTRSDNFLWQVKESDDYDFWIKAIDTTENYSANALQEELTIATPGAVSGSYTINDSFVELSWTESNADFPISYYEIRHGEVSWAAASAVATASGLGFKQHVTWTGTRTFRIKAFDLAGNEGSEETITVTITQPGVITNYVITGIDNNVLINWDVPATGTLPFSYYKIYKGAVFGSAVELGRAPGSFFTYIESVGGSYTYWVTAVDTAGNEGSETGQARVVLNPPDYVLTASDTLHTINDSPTLTDSTANETGTGFYAPTFKTQTFAEHFTDNSYTTIQDFIDNGYPYWLQPTNYTSSTSGVTWEVDLGAVLTRNIITVTWLENLIDGACAVTCNISVKKLVGDSWTDYSDVTQVSVEDFQYVKINLVVDASDDTGLIEISQVHYAIDVKMSNDQGKVEVDLNDTGSGYADGTSVTFNKTFLDIEDIQLTYNHSSRVYIPILNFEDAASPSGFRVLLYDKDGYRVGAGDSGGDWVTWHARGVEDLT